MARRALLAAGAVFAVALVALALPWLTRKETRPTSTPVPPSLYREVLVPLAEGARACVDPVVIEPRTRLASFHVHAIEDRGPALRVTASGPGYESSSAV